MALQAANPLSGNEGLLSNNRQNSQETPTNQNFYPDQAFEFDNPNDIKGQHKDIELKMKDGWKFYVEGIELEQLDVNDRILLEDAIIRSKDNELDIINMGGAVNLHGDEIELRVKAVNAEGKQARDAVIRMALDAEGESYVYVDADSIYLGDKDDDPATLDSILTIENNPDPEPDRVLIKGDLEIESDDANRFVSAGSKGLLVKDSADTLIHDLPDEPLAVGYYTLGHLYYFDGSNSTIVAQYTGGTAPQNSWTDFTPETGGNTNAKGGLFRVLMVQQSFSTLLISHTISLRPKGTTWASGGGAGNTPAPTGFFSLSGTGLTQFANDETLICPFGDDGKVQFNVQQFPYSSPDIIIYQLGVFI